MRMEIVTVTSNDRKSIYKILLPDFSLPLDKVSGKILSRPKRFCGHFAIGTKATSEMPVIRGGILLASRQMEFSSRPNDNLWNSKVFVIEQYTAFGIPESKLYSRWARDAQMLGQDHQSTRIIS